MRFQGIAITRDDPPDRQIEDLFLDEDGKTGIDRRVDALVGACLANPPDDGVPYFDSASVVYDIHMPLARWGVAPLQEWGDVVVIERDAVRGSSPLRVKYDDDDDDQRFYVRDWSGICWVAQALHFRQGDAKRLLRSLADDAVAVPLNLHR